MLCLEAGFQIAICGTDHNPIMSGWGGEDITLSMICYQQKLLFRSSYGSEVAIKVFLSGVMAQRSIFIEMERETSLKIQSIYHNPTIDEITKLNLHFSKLKVNANMDLMLCLLCLYFGSNFLHGYSYKAINFIEQSKTYLVINIQWTAS